MKLKDLRIGNIYEINGNRRVLDTEDICNAIEYCDYDSDDVSYIQPSRIIDNDLPILLVINCYEKLNVVAQEKTGINITYNGESVIFFEYLNDYLDFMKKAIITEYDIERLLSNKELVIKEKYKPINSQYRYDYLLKSGMLFEFYPELSGNYVDDIKLMYE